MTELSFDTRFVALLSMVNIIERLERRLDEMNRKLDLLLYRFNVNYPPHRHDTFATGSMVWNGPGPEVTFDMSAGEVLNPMGTPFLMPGMPSGDENMLWQRGPSYSEDFDLLGTFDDYYLPQVDSNLMALPSSPNDFSTLSPSKLPASMVFINGVWADPPPPTSSVRTVPLPPVAPHDEILGHGGYDSGHHSEGYKNFPGGGPHDHQSNQQRMNSLAQEAESSVSMATTEPENTENNIQPESNSPVASSSGASYNRARNTKEKRWYLEQICKELGITWTGDELSALQTIVERLESTTPVFVESGGPATRENRNIKTKARRACFEGLRRVVGPWTRERFVEREILENGTYSSLSFWKVRWADRLAPAR
ncbi:hypothetical protein BDM02DRAFT_3120037 [Thelephora ganbajun]|uniref:Uncharacterized protein n=1 Tax=Thelephora ganbajun TaxID=370292 RepID=A0ACB6Z7H1_THEGA|nr:hypothetical protein BDM02DRAFT_3120037 [Thelephora ganbajun]